MNTIPQTGKWKDISSILNDNFALLNTQFKSIAELTQYSKGRFSTYEELLTAYPQPMIGSFAYVGTQSPYAIYLYKKDVGWVDSGEIGDVGGLQPEQIIVHETGNATDKVMSQNAVTASLNALDEKAELAIRNSNEALGEAYNIPRTLCNINYYNPNDQDIIKGYYLGEENGAVVEKDNKNYLISGYVPFTQNMRYMVASVNGKTMADSGGLIVLYDMDYEVVNYYLSNAQGVQGVARWEDRVAFVRFSIKDYYNGNIQIEIGTTPSAYIPFGAQTLKNVYNTQLVDSITGKEGARIDIANPEVGTKYEITDFPYHIKKGLCMSFSGVINTFNSVEIGKGKGDYRGRWIVIDNKNIQLKYILSTTENTIKTVAHGLSIRGFIKVSLYIDDYGKMSVGVQTVDKIFNTEFDNCYEMNGAPFVYTADSTFSRIKLSVTNKDFKCPLWAIGDSYFGVTKDRWIGIMKEMGFFNFLADGLAGQKSEPAWVEFQKILRFGHPKYLLWCLGMNDDFESFMHVFIRLKSFCEGSGITLICGLLPSVPSRDKSQIRQLIKERGVRYISFYDAVTAGADGVWVSGYLSNDGVHPTELGAKALATQVLVDFPEIMGYGKLSDEEIVLSKSALNAIGESNILPNKVYYIYEDEQ